MAKGENKLLVQKAIPLELANQAALILKTNHLGVITPKFMAVDYERMETETSVNDPADANIAFYAAEKKSIFGTPVFDVVTFEGLSYTDFKGNTQTIPALTLDIALLEVTNTRNIVTTAVSGRNGTVKEYMSDGDYEINIKGNLINPLANLPPDELVRALHAFCKSQVSIAVTSSLLYYLDIDSIVITKFNFKMVQGSRNVIDYELQCLSDLDPTIQESEDVSA